VAPPSRRGAPTAVYLEAGRRRVFACAVDWPGWSRAGKDEEGALEALAGYAPRYAAVAAEAGVAFPPEAGDRLDVVERVPGSSTTDFGAPGQVPAVDGRPLVDGEPERLIRLVAASWTVLDRVAAGAPADLRKGPRGGGRDRDAVVRHVLGAEASYARKIGIRHHEPALGDANAVAALRGAITTTLRTAPGAGPVVPRGWPPRYAARRIAWHVLDHAWEIEDRSEPARG
jgi:hypothetical protein